MTLVHAADATSLSSLMKEISPIERARKSVNGSFFGKSCKNRRVVFIYLYQTPCVRKNSFFSTSVRESLLPDDETLKDHGPVKLGEARIGEMDESVRSFFRPGRGRE